ncbi:MazG family protein [Sanguibacter sp. A247]|uniref:MazG family protein n=1 Tax=unclassified Sanguibacter TaxID=2645534 RepID=UPI003FD868E0
MSDVWDELVGTMDRLRSPGGCSWDAEQTHESLVRYLLEESAELAEAIELRDRAGLREELGDVLLQVVFHARIAQEDTADPFTIDDVVADLTSKLVHRHPHVFEGAAIMADREAQWDALKAREKQRESVLDGIPAGLGALAAAQKVRGRLRRAGLLDAALDDAVRADAAPADAVPHRVPAAVADAPSSRNSPQESSVNVAAVLGDRLESLITDAEAAGVDLESVLRTRTSRLTAAARRREGSGSASGEDGRTAGPPPAEYLAMRTGGEDPIL